MIEVVRDGLRAPGSGLRALGSESVPGSRVPSPESRVPVRTYYCNICSHEWTVELRPAGRFRSIEDVVQRTGLRRDELTTLAEIGALNAFTSERRSALWQVERAVRPAGGLYRDSESGTRDSGLGARGSGLGTRGSGFENSEHENPEHENPEHENPEQENPEHEQRTPGSRIPDPGSRTTSPPCVRSCSADIEKSWKRAGRFLT
jgi:Helix-hairpin-helix motif